jgi:hypothetical protein
MQVERHAAPGDGVSQLMRHPARQLVQRAELLLAADSGFIPNQPFCQLIDRASQIAQLVVASR